MTNSRVKSEFDYLYQHFVHLSDAEKDLVQRNYKQWTQTNLCTEYKEIRALINRLKEMFDSGNGIISSTFRYGKTNGYRLA